MCVRRFYECLSCCGTDLLLIGTMMPGVTDGQLKRKLKREEKRNAPLVEAALAKKRVLSLQTYEQVGDYTPQFRLLLLRRFLFGSPKVLLCCDTLSVQLHGTIRRELHCQPFNDSDEEPPTRPQGPLALPPPGAVVLLLTSL